MKTMNLRGLRSDRTTKGILILVILLLSTNLVAACGVSTPPPVSTETVDTPIEPPPAAGETKPYEPLTEEECTAQGGSWEVIGMIGEGCNLPTKDGGQPCVDSKACEGLCLPTDPAVMKDDGTGFLISDDDYIKEANGSSEKLIGACSARLYNPGCKVVLEAGKYVVICFD